MSIRRVVHAVTVAGAFACLAPGVGWAQCPSKPKTQDTYNRIAGHTFAAGDCAGSIKYRAGYGATLEMQ